MEFLNTPANAQRTNNASFPRDVADLNYRKQPRQTEVTRKRMRNELIILVTVNAARPSVSDHNRHVIYDSGVTGAAPDTRNDPQQ